MVNILKGAPAAKQINEETCLKVSELKKRGITPKLAILRVGENPDDIYYENSAVKKAGAIGIDTVKVTLPQAVSQSQLEDEVRQLNGDATVSGVLILKPLPKHIDSQRISDVLSPQKDVDGITPGSMYSIYSGYGGGFAPCTASAAMEILKYYKIPVSGRRAVVIGRSLVIGKPVSMLLLKENATVTVCHTKTEDIENITKNADIIITAAGVKNSLRPEMVSENQTVIDVGMNEDENGKMCGDCEFDAVSTIVQNITPVPGGVGSLTTAILLKNTAEAAEKSM